MPIKIIDLPETTSTYHLGQIPLDLTRKTGVLYRQSKKKADQDHYESRLFQENLKPIAIECRGDTDDSNIIVYDEGAGVSGTKGYDERPKLSNMYLDIANDVIGSLFVARPDRLFRDKHFLNVSMFTELAERKKLILVVPGKRVYDFTKYADLEAFQTDMKDAYKYIATHVKYMNDTRDQKRQRGLYVGGNLVAPYVIDKTAWKDEQVPIIYDPWLDPSLDLFTRFKAFDFSVAHICRYIESKPYIFREPSFEDTKRYMFRTSMLLINGGYTFSDFDNVKRYLSNLALGGYMKVGKDEEGNDLFLPNAFDAAIPLDLLDECFAAITGHHIDGSPFEGVKNTRRYMRSNPKGPHVLLHNIMTSDQGDIEPYTDTVRDHYGYECKRKSDEREERTWKIRSLTDTVLWTLPGRPIDRIMLDRLYAIADKNKEIAARVKAVFASMKGQEMDETKLLQEQANKTAKRIERLDFLLTNPNIPLDEETAIQYATELAELRPKFARLTKKLHAQPDIDPETTITNFYFVVGHLATEFEKQGIDVQKQIMSKLVNKVVINSLSPHVFYLYIEWQEGVAFQPDVALLWRCNAIRDKDGWTEEEDEAIRTYWPACSEIDMLRHIPRRNRMNIMQRASDLGVKRLVKKEVGVGVKIYTYHKSISYADLQAIEQCLEGEISEACVLPLSSVHNNDLHPFIEGDKAVMRGRLREKVNELAGSTRRGEISAYFPLPAELLGSFPHTRDGGCYTARPCRI